MLGDMLLPIFSPATSVIKGAYNWLIPDSKKGNEAWELGLIIGIMAFFLIMITIILYIVWG